jgi:dihydrofolate reductase
MRKIVAGLFMSLDGVVESPDKWHFPYSTPEMDAAIGQQMMSSDTMLFGRRTYEEFASYWADKAGDGGFGDALNNTPKLVASTTLTSVSWTNSTLLPGDVNAELTKLKEQPGKDISITGSVTLVQSLFRDGVLDTLRLIVDPIVLGSGRKLFPDGFDQKALKLVDSTVFSSGSLHLTYEPA